MVRQFYYENAVWWLTEFDLDGLRFDAVHEIKSGDRDLLPRASSRATARRASRLASLSIENMENGARWLTRDEDDEPMIYSAQWNDDYRHVLISSSPARPRAATTTPEP